MRQSRFATIRGMDLPVKARQRRGLRPVLVNLESRAVPTVGLAPSFAIVSSIQAPVKQMDLPVITIRDATRLEGNQGTRMMTFQVTRSGDLSKSSSLDYNTTGGNAVEYRDYIPISGKLDFLPTQKSRTIQVILISDSSPEIRKSFHLNLTTPTNVVFQRARATGTILDDDLIKPRMISASMASNPMVHATISKQSLENGKIKAMAVPDVNIPIMPGRPGGSKVGKRPRPI
jgi:hypothetical protein